MKKKQNNNKKVSKIYAAFFVSIIIILSIYTIINFSILNSYNEVNEAKLKKELISNSLEKYQNVNVNYSEIIEKYIDEIFEGKNDVQLMMLHLNLESKYTEKFNITVEDMKLKLENFRANGINLNSYEHKFIEGKDVFICKLGKENLPLTIYEYEPGIYSFAFDGFVE